MKYPKIFFNNNTYYEINADCTLYVDDEIIESDFPLMIKHLRFFPYYSKKINKHVLPKSLISIILGSFYNEKIVKDVLPCNLEILEFGNYYNQEIEKDVLPDSLIKLEFGYLYNKKIKKNILPNSLKFLKIFSYFYKTNKKYLVFYKTKKLMLYFTNEHRDLIMNETLNNIEELEFVNYNNKINHLSNNTKILILSVTFDYTYFKLNKNNFTNNVKVINNF